MSRSPQSHQKHPAEVLNCAASFDGKLDAGESLTGTPAVTATPAGLTLSAAQVSEASLTINGAAVATGRAVQFSVAGGVSGVEYLIEVVCGTTAATPQTLVGLCPLFVFNL